MPPDHDGILSLILCLCPLLLSVAQAHAQAAPSLPLLPRSGDHHDANNPLNIDWDPAPAPEDGPPLSAGALRDPAYLPVQIGAIVGAYAVSLVLVAITLLVLSKKRREHLSIALDEVEFVDVKDPFDIALSPTFQPPSLSLITPRVAAENGDVINFSYPSPTQFEFNPRGPYIYPSPISSIVSPPGVDPLVDQRVVASDKVMAQDQLEEMYKHVMEQEEAKQKGIVLEAPTIPGSSTIRSSTSDKSIAGTLSKKERVKPASLNLNNPREEKTQSRTSSLLSALRSPGKKKSIKALNISSPIMTPQSATFPRQDNPQDIPLRHYAPQPPPPLPSQVPRTRGAPMTPDISPESVQSIDERMGFQFGQANADRASASTSMHHGRTVSQAPTEPESATSDHSQAPLVGLPSSPKPGATFQRPNAPNAVRTGGALPLRAYEPPMMSPTTIGQTTKQTVFERKGPLSPMGARTPATAGAVPYSPYQPFTPLMPMTPSLVTKEDRKRMRRMVPKTPTLEMVQSSDDVW